MESEVRRAHVVAIVYAVNDARSFDRIAEYWLPTLRSLGVNVPVVLVGNKIDLRSDTSENFTIEALEAEVQPLMQAYKEIETCAECSARSGINIAEIFYFAQRAVLYPTAPLYDSRQHTLKQACINALNRIFKLCDLDKDDLLNDEELNGFQQRCFNRPLQQTELDSIKERVREQSSDMSTEAGLTLEGFLFLHTCFIQNGRMETTWMALRTFGYGQDLQLKEDFVNPRFDVSAECSVELTPQGYEFLSDLFQRHDKDQDGALSPEEVDDLFSTSPGNPWATAGFPQNTTVTNEDGYVTLQGWLAQWSMTTLLEHRLTLAYLAYLGYQFSSASTVIPLTSAVSCSAPRKTERKKDKSHRNVFTAVLLGASGTGKTSLMRRFVGRDIRGMQYEATQKRETVVNAVELKGSEKYLVLQEYGRDEPELLRSSKKLANIDMVCYCYDSSDTNSFSYISNLRATYKALDSVPSIFVATKSDQDLAVQRHEVQPDAYCRRLCLRSPVSVSHRHPEDLYTEIVAACVSPGANKAVPGGVQKTQRNPWTWCFAALGLGLGGLGAYALISGKGFRLFAFLPLFSTARVEL